MKVRALYFSLGREAVGRRELVVEIPSGGTVAELWRSLVEEHPQLRNLSSSLMFAVNQEYVNPETPLKEGDEVAFIPPVSGGIYV
ncbi:MAG: molybdopterin converting factor subunit 1 [candidate division NC10 bacterium]|nr:molybdopterin converting factor subunit 1 [candidate division NC10 bacterium]